MTPGPWTVAAGLAGEHARHNGRVVVDREGRAVADCENDAIPIAEQCRNARAIAALPEIVDALVATEDHIGDLPRNPAADRLYRDIAHALGKIRHGGS